MVVRTTGEVAGSFPPPSNRIRLICIVKDDGSARPLTMMLVAYSIWAARAARLLGAWFPAELVGGRGGSPPALCPRRCWHNFRWYFVPDFVAIVTVGGR